MASSAPPQFKTFLRLSAPLFGRLAQSVRYKRETCITQPIEVCHSPVFSFQLSIARGGVSRYILTPRLAVHPTSILKPPFIMANFITLSISLLLCLNADARSLAQPAVQHLSPRAEYQGGWPLALIGTASSSCPASASESCSSTVQNPACCPSGQTCIFSPSIYASYCCPTSMCIPRFTVTITFLMTSRR